VAIFLMVIVAISKLSEVYVKWYRRPSRSNMVIFRFESICTGECPTGTPSR